MERFLSAPGKLFVSGEYAVLWGGAARIAAVGPRSEAYVRRRDDTQVHLVLEEGRLTGPLTPLGVRWDREIPQGFRFAAFAVDEVVRAQADAVLGFTLAMAPTPKDEQGQKLGLGSSARAALLAAEAARYALESRVDPLKVALVAHATAQGGRGSGGDVAASYAGGLLRYRRFPVERVLDFRGPRSAALAEAPQVDLLRLKPLSWEAIYVQAGKGASTPKQIASVEARLPRDKRAGFVERSDALGQDLEDALVKGDWSNVSDALFALRSLLRELGSLETEEAERVLALASSNGCAGKISGAGGGDGCLVLCPDRAHRTDLLEAYTQRGIRAFPVDLEPGLRGEPQGNEELRVWAA
jgi:phosphomevalonate kinase